MYNKYLEKLDFEIDNLVKEETISSGDLNYDAQKTLHILFENRKHLLEYMKGFEKSHMHGGKHTSHVRKHIEENIVEDDEDEEDEAEETAPVRAKPLFRGGQ